MAEVAEAQLEAEQLRRINEVKSRFLNLAAHELNTPITPIRLQLHLLQSGAMGHLEESQRKAVGIVSRNVDRLAELVQEILDVARIEGGGIRVRMEPVPLDHLVREVWDAYEEPARRVGIRLLRPAATNAVVRTDRQRALQVLYNLMSNAIKFTPADGEIRMTVDRAAPDRVRLCVVDTGAGLTPEQAERLFKPFARVHDDLITSGTGLGLYICQGLLQQMDGTIDVASPGPGKGSSFCITLPLAGGVAARIESPRTAEEEALAHRLRELI